MDLAKKNVAALAACQALLVANNSTLIAVGGLAGYALAPNKSIATLTVTAWVLGTALATVPVSLLMRRIGRRGGFYLGTGFGLAGAGLGALAVYLSSFWLLCLGMLACGVYNAAAQYYRFAAADAASSDFKSTAISLVLAGGLVGGLIGPEISKLTVDGLAAKFMGTYLSLMVYVALVMLLLLALRIPPAADAKQPGSGRSLWEIAAQPSFLVAVIGGALGYGVMNFLMVATPIAMGICGHPYHSAAVAIQWHVISMFAPSFFTGRLIRRFGVLNMMLLGVLLLAVSVAIALTGIAVENFWFALVALGVGWNFLYIGGTTLLTETYAPAELAKTQGINDFIIFFVQAVTSLASGWLLDRSGWAVVNMLAVPMIVMMAAAILWLMYRRRLASAV